MPDTEKLGRVTVYDDSVTVQLSAADTFRWANRPGASWPCSTLSLHAVWAQFDRGGLIDVRAPKDMDGAEFDAIMQDATRGRIPSGHPCECVI